MLNVAPIWTPDVQQQNYRALLDAMSRPGQIKPILWHEDDMGAITAALATLSDGEVSIADPDQLLVEDSWPLLQAQRTEADHADYIVCDGNKTARLEPKLGTLASPEQSTTLLLSVGSLTGGNLRIRLSGPGVKDTVQCAISGLDRSWLSQREDWVCAFPLGVDFLLVDRDGVMGLPRTTRVEVL